MGMVFNLQRFSVHDGPGVRTTVFLKGCPLRCLWCHNPESAHAGRELGYHRNRCVGCRQCIGVCPHGALSLTYEGIRRDLTLCRDCFACADACPTGAMEVYGREMTAEEVVETAIRDKRYYDKTGGGVTFSGGEPLSQPEFVSQTARLLHAEGISTAVETSLYGGAQALELVAGASDLVMADLKVMNDELHIRATGCSNRPILENIKRLAALGANVLIRVPVVPGVSDSVDNIEHTAHFLLGHTPYRTMELIPMHKLAAHKYEALGRDYPAQDIPLPSEERMQLLRRSLIRLGFEVRGIREES